MTTIAGVKMADMKRSKVSLKSANVGKISPDPYSYEHRINLDQDALTKMGISGTPKVGDIFHVMGEGHIHSVSSDSGAAGSSLHIGIQLRKMGMQKKGGGGAGSKGNSGALGAVSQGIKDAG